MITYLCVADSHSEPDQSLRRFEALGSFILEHKPDVIVQLGDFVSLSAISHWDMSKRLKMEGQRYRRDIAAGYEAVNLIFGPMEAENDRRRKNKKATYNPQIVWLNGNHENWIERYVEQNPEMEGMLDLGVDLGLKSKGITPIPYRSRVELNGINFMHAPLAGNDQPLSGLHIPYKALQRFNGNIVFGHYHRTETASNKRTDATTTHRAISCPAFFEGTPHYLSPSAPAVIDRGFLMLHQDETGWPTIDEISMDQLLSAY